MERTRSEEKNLNIRHTLHVIASLVSSIAFVIAYLRMAVNNLPELAVMLASALAIVLVRGDIIIERSKRK